MEDPSRKVEARPWRKRTGKHLRLAATLVVFLLLAALTASRDTLIDRLFIFFPQKEVLATPGDIGLAFEEVFFQASDGVALHGWFVPGPEEITWLWFHGNAGNISHRLENLLLVHQRLGVNVFLFDYRGYGRSAGHPSEQGVYLDAQGAFSYLRSRPDIDPDKIVLFGRSVGCAVAIDLATRHKPYGLILESPFTSVADMAKRTFPFLPMGFLVKSKFDSLSKIKRVSAPVLVLHGNQDEIVPIEQGKTLYEAANQPKSFYTIAGAGHNDTYAVGGEPYFATLNQFLASLT